MRHSKIQREILGLEGQYWKAMQDGDVDKAVSMTKFPCVITSPKGAQRITQEKYRQMMKSHDVTQFKDFEVKNAQVNMLNSDTAIISYSMKVNGINMLDVSTWVHQDGKWLCAFHSENPHQ